MVIGLDYISNNLSPTKINQEHYCGERTNPMKCHCLLSVEHSEPEAAAMYSCTVEKVSNNIVIPIMQACNFSICFLSPVSLQLLCSFQRACKCLPAPSVTSLRGKPH